MVATAVSAAPAAFDGPLLVPGAATRPLDDILRGHAEQGYFKLGPIASPEILRALRERADAIMLGQVQYEGLYFQAESPSGAYADLPYGRGWQGPTLAYRKLEKLEKDPLFRAYLENELFERIARALIDDDIVLCRAVLMTKAARGGTPLPWHQDGGLFWGLSQDPILQIWTALDDAPVEAGCVEVLPGSHIHGLATPMGGVVPPNHLAAANANERAVPVPAKAGDGIVIHNHLWHRSGVNATPAPRRGFSVCFMSASTRCTRTKKAPRVFPPVFRR
jgi:phytanoyl-CoA hydroxylase